MLKLFDIKLLYLGRLRRAAYLLWPATNSNWHSWEGKSLLWIQWHSCWYVHLSSLL